MFLLYGKVFTPELTIKVQEANNYSVKLIYF